MISFRLLLLLFTIIFVHIGPGTCRNQGGPGTCSQCTHDNGNHMHGQPHQPLQTQQHQHMEGPGHQDVHHCSFHGDCKGHSCGYNNIPICHQGSCDCVNDCTHGGDHCATFFNGCEFTENTRSNGHHPHCNHNCQCPERSCTRLHDCHSITCAHLHLRPSCSDGTCRCLERSCTGHHDCSGTTCQDGQCLHGTCHCSETTTDNKILTMTTTMKPDTTTASTTTVGTTTPVQTTTVRSPDTTTLSPTKKATTVVSTTPKPTTTTTHGTTTLPITTKSETTTVSTTTGRPTTVNRPTTTTITMDTTTIQMSTTPEPTTTVANPDTTTATTKAVVTTTSGTSTSMPSARPSQTTGIDSNLLTTRDKTDPSCSTNSHCTPYNTFAPYFHIPCTNVDRRQCVNGTCKCLADPPTTTTTTTTTTSKTTPTGPVMCHTCGDSNSPCDIRTIYLGHLTRCPSHQRFCMTDVYHTLDNLEGSVYKRCVDEDTCKRLWLDQTSDIDTCVNYSKSPGQYTCHFCCKGDGCNSNVLPSSSTLAD